MVERVLTDDELAFKFEFNRHSGNMPESINIDVKNYVWNNN